MGAASTASTLDAVDLLATAEREGRSLLLEHEVYALLASAGIDVPRFRLVRDAAQIDSALCRAFACDELVVKVVSPDVLHKTEAGGVRIVANQVHAVADAVAGVLEAVRRSAPRAEVRGALIVEKVTYGPSLGLELLAGFRHDPAFGAVVAVGMGGLDSERLLVSLRPEASRRMWLAEELGDGVAGAEQLAGTIAGAALFGRLRSSRGPAIEPGALARLLARLGALGRRLAGFAPESGLGLKELEVNPFVAADGRLVALDGLARLHRPALLAPPRPLAGLRCLFRPQSAAVAGVSSESVNVGRVILRNLVEGGGVARERVFAIHPRAAEIDGCRAVPSLQALPAPVDLAVIALPAERSAAVVEEALATRRARSVTLIPGGFAETEAGRPTEERLRRALSAAHLDADGGVLVNGGNCLGVVSEPGRYSTFFIPGHKLPLREAPVGGLAGLSQSGAYLVTQISRLMGVVRLRYAVSFGNQIDLTLADHLEYLAGDPEARVFSVYLEGFAPGDGARLLRLARRLRAEGRPLVFYKAGRSEAGGRAAASHTAAAVGDYEVCRELVESAGAVVCASLDDFEDVTLALTLLAGRPAAGRRIAVLSNAGFECTVAADALGRLELAALSASTRETLAALLPPGVVDVHNPLDTTPTTPTERYVACAEALLADPGVDALLLAGVPATPALDTLAAGPAHREDVGGEGSLPARLARLFAQARKPIVFSVDAGELYDEGVRVMLRAGLPTYRRADRAVRALAAYVAFHGPQALGEPGPGD
ncbi:MAG: acetate--CoA ligase family protein [Vicinamibacteria bacterium]